MEDRRERQAKLAKVAPFFLHMVPDAALGTVCMDSHKGCFANEWPLRSQVAVAAARNISGGVNPSVKLPAAPQPFVLKGPLEPPVGGNLIHLPAPES